MTSPASPPTQPQPPAPSTLGLKRAPLRPVLVVGLIFLGVMAVVAASKWYTPPERVKWRADLPAELAEARATNKPVLLYFTAEWCGPCQYMKRYVFSDAAVSAAVHDRFIPVRLDHDRRPDLIVHYQIDGIPWFAVLDADGNPTRKLERGVETPQELIAWLTESNPSNAAAPATASMGR